ncbi:MAG: hypothetical protein ACE367_25475 [Acidimicrobiales bacterium]
MSVTEAQRLTLGTSLVAAIGEPATNVLMEAMPPIDHDKLATKADIEMLRADMNARFAMVDARCGGAERRTEMAERRASLRADFARQTRILVCSHLASMLGLTALILRFG